MKMHYTIAPIGLVSNARGVSRLTGFTLSAAPTNRVHGCAIKDWTGPPPSGRKRRF